MIGMFTNTNKQENEVVTHTTDNLHNSSVSEEITYLYQKIRELESLIIQGKVLMYLIIIERKRNNFLSSDYQFLKIYILSLIVLHIIALYMDLTVIFNTMSTLI